MNNEAVRKNNDIEKKADAKRTINSCAKQLTHRYCKMQYEGSTTIGNLEMRNLSRGFLGSMGIWDEVLENSLPSLHYSYTMNQCSVDEFEDIIKSNIDKLDVFDYDILPINELANIVQKFCAFIGLSKFIAPGRRVIDFWNIINNNPSVLGEVFELEDLTDIVEYTGEFETFVMNDIQRIIIEYLENVETRLKIKEYELIETFFDNGYDIYIIKGEELVINKETNGTEVRYYMSQITYDSLAEKDFENLGNRRKVYKMK